MAAYKTLILYQGTTFCEIFDLTDIYNQTINLANYTAISRMAKNPLSENYTELTTEIVDYTSGKIKVTLSSEETTKLSSGRYVFEVLLIDTYQVITKLIDGIIDVIPGIGLSTKTYLE